MMLAEQASPNPAHRAIAPSVARERLSLQDAGRIHGRRAALTSRRPTVGRRELEGDIMKTFAPLMYAAAAAALLAGCAYDEGYGHRGYYSGASYGYDSYYDNYYGPLYDGYWGGDGAFYYRGAEGRPYQRDTGDHFRRDQHQGYNRVQGQTRGGGAYRGDGDHHDGD